MDNEQMMAHGLPRAHPAPFFVEIKRIFGVTQGQNLFSSDARRHPGEGEWRIQMASKGKGSKGGKDDAKGKGKDEVKGKGKDDDSGGKGKRGKTQQPCRSRPDMYVEVANTTRSYTLESHYRNREQGTYGEGGRGRPWRS
jgi:hypothetical protein